MNRNTSRKIGILYLFFFIILIITSIIYVYYDIRIKLMLGPTNLFSNLTILIIFLGIPMSFLFLISIGFLYYLNLRNAIISGLVGCLLIGIINSFVLIIYSIPFNSFLFISLLIPYLLILTINIILIRLKIMDNPELEIEIKKTVLELGKKFTRLKIKEISERCDADQDKVISVIKSMIKLNEISGEYFSSSRTLTINQQNSN